MKIARADVENLLAKFPALKPLLARWIRAAEKGKRLPESFTTPVIDFEAQRGLEKLLMTKTGRTLDGKVYGTLLPMLREPSTWLEACAVLTAGETPQSKVEPVDTFLLRLKWLHPGAGFALEILGESAEVTRYLSEAPRRANWKTLFESVLRMAQSKPAPLVTLSQLGSDWFNDSKILRSGPLRRQLVLIMAALARMEPDDEKEVLAGLGIEANPYTTAVTIFAPISFITLGGAQFDFPLQLYRQGLACQLPAETALRIDRVIWHGDTKEIATSENAAPLVRFIAAGRPVLYTEGYPNYAVIKLMELLSRQDVVAEHWGDADLDGLRIAEEVRAFMPGSRVVAERILAAPSGLTGIPLTEAQRLRLERYVSQNPNCSYGDALKRLLAGYWYEQESFPCCNGTVCPDQLARALENEAAR